MSHSARSTLHLDQCLEIISKWRSGADFVPHCPECKNPEVQITDHSSRPHTEWYRLFCEKCGFEHFVSCSLGSTPFSIES